jgi:hypothetical protein
MATSRNKQTAPLDTAPRSDVNSTLSERQNTHGDFIQNAVIMQTLKDVCRNSKNWDELNPFQQEAIDLICHKLGRILAGDPDFPDHWHDICGYSKLVENILTTGKSTL